jgi:PAS domain S-box-containing protein
MLNDSVPRLTTDAAHETAGRLAAILETAVDGIITIDERGTIETVNPATLRIFGYEAHELIGQNVRVLMPEPYRGEHDAYLANYLRTGERKIIGIGRKVQGRRKDGSIFPLELAVSETRLGERCFFTGIVRDITARKAAEQALRESEERFRLLVGGMVDYATFMFDLEGRVVSWNSGAERIKGYTAEQILGKHFSVFYPPEDNARGKPAWELVVASREGRLEDEGWRVRKDGSLFWANVVITALRDESGTLIGFAKVTRDLSERVQAEHQAIENARRVTEAETANRTKSEFLAVLSHELRTPLNAIGGYADLMQMELAGPLTEQQRLYLTRVRDSQQHLLRVINDLLNYSRTEAGKVTYEQAPVPLGSVLETVIGMESTRMAILLA